jgi:hypothetical protein
MTDGSRPEDAGFDDSPYEEEAYEPGFDDQPIEDDPEAYEPAGFDDEPLDEDPDAQPGYAPGPVFATGNEYDADTSRTLRTESLRRVRQGSGGALFVGVLVTAMIAGIPVLGVIIFLLSQKKEAGIEGKQIDLGDGRVVVRQSGPPQKIVWSDVSKNASQTIGGVAVKVVQASVGKARARDESNRVVFTGDDYLRIGMEVESFKETPFEYVSWYGRQIEQFDGPDRVRLYDAEDNELSPHVFADVRSLEGHTPRKTLDTRDSLRDALYFDLPKGKSVDDLGELRLTIPHDSQKGNAKYGFKIPNELIVRDNEPSTAVDPNAPLSDDDLKALTGEDDEMEP